MRSSKTVLQDCFPLFHICIVLVKYNVNNLQTNSFVLHRYIPEILLQLLKPPVYDPFLKVRGMLLVVLLSRLNHLYGRHAQKFYRHRIRMCFAFATDVDDTGGKP
jgi:hypothetical protein